MTTYTDGPARERLSAATAETLLASGALVTDGRRRRPHYFDGRFLSANDLIADQLYVLTRQGELGRAGGSGVVHGLHVALEGPTQLSVRSGLGVTPTGELVVLPATRRIDLSRLEEEQRLDAAFGLQPLPRETPRQRTGLYVLGLRPVEFSANPTVSYPTTLDGPRTVADADIIEATAISLIPYGERSERSELDMRRAAVARDLFLGGARQGLPAGVLPLAVVALDRGVLQWVDPWLVRREVGRDHGDILGMGFAPRALREAHVLQYEAHLREVLTRRRAAGRSPAFAATEQFALLPAAGRMPAAAINTNTFVQIYFPAEVDVELSVMAEDELPAMLEESLLLPPIDLTGQTNDLDATSVLIVIPVPRPRMRLLQATLGSLRRPVRKAAPDLIAKRRPFEVLQAISPVPIVPPADTQVLIDAAWRDAMAGIDLLWYVRRRNVNFKADVAGAALRIHGDELRDERALVERLKETGQYNRFHRLKTDGSAEADAEMVFMLSSAKFERSETLIEGALVELRALDRMDRASVLRVAQRYSDPELSNGMLRLEAADPTLTADAARRTVGAAAIVPELDLIGRRLPEDRFLAFAQQVGTLANAGQRQQLRELVLRTLPEITR